MNISKLQQATEELSIAFPFMKGREKKLQETIEGEIVTVEEYGFLKDEKKGTEFVCYTVKEYPDAYFFGGLVLTKGLKALDEKGLAGDIKKEGLPVRMHKERCKGDNKKDVTIVEYYPKEK